MKFRQITVLCIFSVACVVFSSFVFLFASEECNALSSKGFKVETLSVFPQWLRGLYQGYPSFMALLNYVLFTLSAFLFLKEKSRGYKLISSLSFVLLLCVFVFLM